MGTSGYLHHGEPWSAQVLYLSLPFPARKPVGWFRLGAGAYEVFVFQGRCPRFNITSSSKYVAVRAFETALMDADATSASHHSPQPAEYPPGPCIIHMS